MSSRFILDCNFLKSSDEKKATRGKQKRQVSAKGPAAAVPRGGCSPTAAVKGVSIAKGLDWHGT